MKKTHTLALAFVLLASTSIAFAETGAGTDTNATTGSGTAATGETIVSPRDPASGLPTGKRQHQPAIIHREIHGTASTTVQMDDMRAKMMDAREKASSTRAQMKENAGDRRGEIEQKKNEMRNGMQDRMANIIQKQGDRIIKRLEAALERLNNIAGRIDSRITKLGEKGVDTTKAKADLAIAKTKIDAAKVKLDAAKIAIAGIMNDTGTVATSTPGNMVSGKLLLIKEQVRGVEEALKDAHKALVLAASDLKGKSGKVNATTTTTVRD